MAKRGTNFSTGEVFELMELVNQYKHILENKKSDAVTNKQKLQTWDVIAEKFNSKQLVPRDSQSLRNKYENVKKTTKKKFALEKQQTYMTGGGKAINSSIEPVDEMVHQKKFTSI